MTEASRCPRIAAPCPQPPQFAAGQRVAFCTLCQQQVHDLSALNASEQTALLARNTRLCVRLKVVTPLLAAAMALGSAAAAPTQLTPDPSADVEDMFETGLLIAPAAAMLPLFEPSELPESFDEAVAATPQTES